MKPEKSSHKFIDFTGKIETYFSLSKISIAEIIRLRNVRSFKVIYIFRRVAGKRSQEIVVDPR